MPVSQITKGSSVGGKKKRSKSRPTTSRRNERQKIKERYAKAREDAQRVGLITTTPEGAVRQEAVDPRLQGCQQLPDVVLRALRESWATPNEAKPGIIGALLEPFYADDVVLDRDGNQVRLPRDRGQLMKLAQVLKELDQTQYERDNPEAGKNGKGGDVVVNIAVETVDKPGESTTEPKQVDPQQVEVVTVDCGGEQDRSGVPEAAGLH